MPAVAMRVATRKAANTAAIAARHAGAGKRSKTGAAFCSQAMSSWVKARHGGPPVNAEVYKILAKCRQMAAQNRAATKLQVAGKIAPGRGTWQRAEQAATLKAQRAEQAATSPAKSIKATIRPGEAENVPADWMARRDRIAAARRLAGGRNLTDSELTTLFPEDRRKSRPTTATKPKPGPSATTPSATTPSATTPTTPRNVVPRPGDPALRAQRAADLRRQRSLGNHGTAGTIRRLPLDHEARQAARVAARVKRAEKNVAIVKEHLAKGGMAVVPSMTRPKIYRHAENVHGVSRDGSILVRDGRRVVAIPGGDATRIFASDARKARAKELRAELEARRASRPSQIAGERFRAAREAVKAPVSPEIRAKVLTAIRATESQADSGAPTGVHGLRGRLKDVLPTKSAFDRVIRKLGDDGTLNLYRHDAPFVYFTKAVDRQGFVRRGQNGRTMGLRGLARRNEWDYYNAVAIGPDARSRTSSPSPSPSREQKGLFDRPDARATPRDASQSQRLADRLWSMGQRQKRDGSPDAAGTFARHDELMSRAYRLAKKGNGTEIHRGAGRQLVGPAPTARTTPTPAPTAVKRSEWRAMVESSRRDQAQRRERRAERLGKLRGERSQGVRDLRPSQIQTDAERFQYKLAHNKEGSVGSLSGVKKWDPERGGILQVWRDPADGKTYVVNGHNRLELARRVGADKVTVRYIQARDATEARAKGAITNIVEGRGTSVDAAKFLRDQKLTRREDFDALDLPVREKVATEGLALAGLEPRAFRAVIDGALPVQRAAIVGGSGLSHAQQRAALDLVEKRKGEITDKVLKELVSEVRLAGTARKGGGGLFGDDPEETSLAIHRASLVAHVKDRLGREKRVFGTVAQNRNAKDLERAGNTIDTEASHKVSQRAAENLGVFDQMRRLRGSTSDLIAEAEQRLAKGETKAQVYADFYERLPKALKADAK